MNDLPRHEWSVDTPAYREIELKILTQMGPDILACVHATKQLFGAEVVCGGRRSASAQAHMQDKERQQGKSVKNQRS